MRNFITIQLVLQQCCKMSNLRSGVPPHLFGRRGEKDALYIHYALSSHSPESGLLSDWSKTKDPSKDPCTDWLRNIFDFWSY